MVLVWVIYAFMELFLYLPLLSGAFLVYAKIVLQHNPPEADIAGLALYVR
jgi:hypothetical protein